MRKGLCDLLNILIASSVNKKITFCMFNITLIFGNQHSLSYGLQLFPLRKRCFVTSLQSNVTLSGTFMLIYLLRFKICFQLVVSLVAPIVPCGDNGCDKSSNKRRTNKRGTLSCLSIGLKMSDCTLKRAVSVL